MCETVYIIHTYVYIDRSVNAMLILHYTYLFTYIVSVKNITRVERWRGCDSGGLYSVPTHLSLYAFSVGRNQALFMVYLKQRIQHRN